MPFATFTRIREVSSEDNVHLAENLIKSQPGKKWKTKSAGEKSAYVILEMSEAQQIIGIDIGNEHSAFIEVLVGKSSSAPEEFKDILITCSFMTPPESKNSNNTNRVRCFNQNALDPTSVEKTWSLVKIVCTQPFNRHVQYGLSFIKVHVSQNQQLKIPTVSKNLVPEQILKKISESKYDKLSPLSIGKLKFREDSPESESETSSSLFNRWKKTKDNKSEPTTAASIRLASRSPMTTVQRRLSDVLSDTPTNRSIEKDVQIIDRNRDNLMFGDDNEDDIHKDISAKRDRLTKQIEADKERRRMELQKQEDKQKSKLLDTTVSIKNKEHMRNEIDNINLEKAHLPSTSTIVTESIRDKEATVDRTNKRRSSPTVRPNKRVKLAIDSKKYRPFNQLLKGVVLVISGIQNPDRGDLRNKAVALGAKYKGDWDKTCTHLICAFKNTPKYNQVRGKGKIVTRSWIEKCFSLKKNLPWRRYALDSDELTKPESEDEILDASLQSQQDEDSNDAEAVKTATTRRESEDRNNTLALYDIDDQPKSNNILNRNSESHSDSDTDDEIQRIEQRKKNETKKTKPMPTKEQDIYEVSTDEEEYLQNKLTQLDSLNFFNLFIFFICEDINGVDKIKLEKLIEQYAGRLTNNPSEAHYAVTNHGLNNCEPTFSGEIVRPLWIYECNILQAKLPTNRYLI